MRGGKPIPISLIKLKGTYNATRHRRRAREPVAPPGALMPPDFLTSSQRAIWVELVANAPAGVLAKADAAILYAMVVATDQHRVAMRMQAKLDENNSLPLLAKGRAGDTIMSPYLRVMSRAADLMIRCSSELGFTPVARARLGTVDAAPLPSSPGLDSPWTKLKLLQGGLAAPGKNDDSPDAA